LVASTLSIDRVHLGCKRALIGRSVLVGGHLLATGK